MAEGSTRTRKLQKEIDYDNGVVTITVVSTGDKVVCDASKLPKDIQKKLVPLALNHRIGDAAAGKDGTEAAESMQKVWDALVNGDFTVKAPAGSKLPNKTQLREAVGNLKGKEAEAANALLAKLGIQI